MKKQISISVWLLCSLGFLTEPTFAADPPPPPLAGTGPLPLHGGNGREQKLEQEKDLEQLTLPSTNATPSEDDVLRKQTITTVNDPTKDQPKTNRNQSDEPRMTAEEEEKELLANPETLEKILTIKLATMQMNDLEKFTNIYKKVENRDESLIEWSHAMLLVKESLNKAIHEYRVLLSKFPDNNFLRYQLASLLYQNQEFDAAKVQFEKLRASSEMNKEDIKIFDNYLEAIANKNKWSFNFSMSFLNDRNLTDSADQGTVMVLPNGATLTQTEPKQEGKGVNVNFGADKRWSLNNGRYFGVAGSTNINYYWNNKQFNEANVYVSANYGYSDARLDLRVAPFILKRFNVGDPKNSNRLKAYTNTAGITFSSSYWLTPSLKHFANYSYSKEHYINDSMDNRYKGNNNAIGTSLMYLIGSKQYIGGGVDFSRRSAPDSVNAYRRYSSRIFWGQEWPLGFSTTTSYSYARRIYDEASWLGARRVNREQSLNISLWNKAVHYKGITPRLTFTKNKTISNLSIYSYQRKNLYLEFDKTF